MAANRIQVALVRSSKVATSRRRWPLSVLAALVWSLGSPAPALAQLPLPGFDGDLRPQIRLASRDELTDRATTIVSRLERTLEERRPDVAKERASLESRLSAWTAAPEDIEGPTRPTSESRLADIRVARRLIAALGGEVSALEDALSAAKHALEEAGAPQEPADASGLDALIAAELAARTARQTARASDVTSKRLRALVAGDDEPRTPKPTLEDRLVAQEWRVQLAHAERADARALEHTAIARRLTAHVEAQIDSLTITEDTLAVYRAELGQTRAENEAETAKIGAARKALESGAGLPAARTTKARAARRALALTRFELIDRQEEALEARLLRARARITAATALANEQVVELTGDLSPARIVSLIGDLEQRRMSVEARGADVARELAGVPAADAPLRELIELRQQAVEEALGVIAETRQSLAVVETISALGARLDRPAVSARFGWGQLLWTLLVALIATLLFFHGLKLVHVLLGAGAKLVHLRKRRQTQIETALSLLWPVIVILGAAAVIVWPVFDLDVTFREAVSAVDQALFYVEDKPVSLFSIIQLVFAVWASVVLSRLVRDLMSSRVYDKLGWDIGLTTAFDTMVHYVFLLTGGILGLRFVGIGLQSLAIFAGVLGIGIGFGLRNVTENFISGLIILAERPVKIGDFIEITDAAEGRVEHIRARSTTVITRDNVSVIIPNSEFVSGRVINWSHGDAKVRIRVVVGVAYGSDTDLVRKALLEVAGRHGQVLKKPPPEVHFEAFGGSSLDFALLVWIDEQVHRFRIASDLHFAVDKAFRKLHVEIAFPQLDLHFKTVTAGLVSAVRSGLEDEPPPASALPTGRPEILGTTKPTGRPGKT